MRFHGAAGWIASLAFLASLSATAVAGNPPNWPGLQDQDWVVTGPAAVRLISGHDRLSPNGGAQLGVQIKLRPGWWTYWRSPGDTGMPPDFNWAGSQNIRWAPELFWPKPQQKASFGHALRVYKDEVVFPLRVVATNPSKPVGLKLNLTFGVCKDVCVPISASVELALNAKTGALPIAIPEHLSLIRRYEAEVPTANAQAAGIRIQNVGLIKDAKGAAALAIEIDRAGPTARPIVLVELSPGEPPSIAKSLGRASEVALWRFAADLEPEHLSGGPLAGRRVRVTIFDGKRSLEQIWVVGAAADSSGSYGSATPGRQIVDTMRATGESWKPRD
jgi:suppressor for copper-sensitivity B